MEKLNIIQNGILEFILGDAVDALYEFEKRENIDNVDMIGNDSQEHILTFIMK